MSNPLLNNTSLPKFSQIQPEHVVPAIEQLIQQCRDTIEQVSQINTPTWENFYLPQAITGDKLSRAWSPVGHLNSVKNSSELREAYQACLPMLSEYSTWVGQHQGLYQGYVKLKNSPEFATYSLAQKKAIENSLRDFELSGISLPADKQKRYGEISARLSELSSQFSNNVLDATMGWDIVIEDEADLKGLPESALEGAKFSAQSKEKSGYRFTLEFPSYLPVMTYCENRELRQKMYEAYNTRASDQGPNAGKWDNSALMAETLELRLELAKLLGFENYAELSLATKMAENPTQVVDFLEGLANRSKEQGKKELAELKAFAKESYGVSELQPWDIAFYSEKQKQALYAINDEELRLYFPEERVLSGLFELVKRIFGMRVEEQKEFDSYHENVRFFNIFDETDRLRGSFYLDLYARENKRGGAWMDDCINQKRLADGSLQKPVAYLTCNFNKPIGDKPALFTHDEVTTLFHEFGHGIHHMLTEIDVGDVSGINGVPWDAVELPSQFLENWCWEEDALAFISGHYQTGEPLPKEKLTQLLKAKNFQAAMFVLRQLEFGLFDFRLHMSEPKENIVLDTLKAVKAQVAVVELPTFVRTPHSFSHIFAGGYAAGYYSYLWAEVLSADAFARFEEEGIFNREVGQSFLDNILTRGGSEEPMVLFERFRGRKPTLDALLRHKGIARQEDKTW
ncbi:oligopeptidase A [Glaesserella parasuis]|uniref:oligopeptidase A n=1 Tax=Glaesserella parasuis ZJ0906 TaxID=1322346 RepID=A0A806J0H3_GLAPU|nr:oligopeptidase A [Glaesserella parasuis]AGO15339.1 oligopeptidase A [Glaesserella parasuis ZJ0906]ATW44744.1 oligopeptidase A [Glaesserella parasuis str. Nagasaki]EQA01603.1 oligopeptidase A [Glaesserella parasuis str. Nagasaki]EYE72864.1 oligopeptidase A [Glaesserella parasuis str. Nagasaki]MCT8546615.1 oligopeptidase A [Glaesserella parasuis]